MSEFQTGIFKLIANTSLGRALIYTSGHIIIAMSVVSVLTGASLWEEVCCINRTCYQWCMVLFFR